VWSRSDSQETFYGCSDVVFDGGNGQVTGIGGGTQPPPSPDPSIPPTSTPPSSTPPSSAPPSSTPPSQNPGGASSATFAVTNSWSGGFQGSVTVRAGTAALNSWMVHFSFPGGQSINQAWNAKYTPGSTVTLSNESWNGSIPAGGSTTVGFTGTGSAPSSVNGLVCM